MLKTELKLVPHIVLPGKQVIELWHAGKFIGQICGAAGRGVRIISNHPMSVVPMRGLGSTEIVNIVEVLIE